MKKVINYCRPCPEWRQKFFSMELDEFTFKAMDQYDLGAIPFFGKRYKKTLGQGLCLLKNKGQCTFLHSYNKIPLQKIPWLIEVESYLPRFFELNIRNPFIENWIRNQLNGPYCKKIIFKSQYANNINKSKLKRWNIPSSKYEVIYQSVDVFEPIEKSDDTFNISFVGRNFFRKGGRELLRAFKRNKKDDWRLSIATNFESDYGPINPTPESTDRIRKQIDEDPQINLTVNCAHDSIPSLLLKSHVYVSATYADTFNTSVTEALGCGLPVITTDVGGIPEMVEDHHNGFLYRNPMIEDSDAISEYIGEKLQTLYQDSMLRKQMSARSLDIAKAKFSHEKRVAAYVRIYREVSKEIDMIPRSA